MQRQIGSLCNGYSTHTCYSIFEKFILIVETISCLQCFVVVAVVKHVPRGAKRFSAHSQQILITICAETF